jgi:subtilisin family serine protease
MWWSGPADLPRPAAPVPAPEAASPARRQVTVAVLDTGLSPHPWYEDAAWYAEQRAEVAEVLDADLDFELDSQAGHGTFIAGVLLRYAPSARLRAYRVIGGDGVGDELEVVRALSRLAAAGGADVVNLSIGCHTFDDRPSPLMARAIASLGRRTVVVACAGNAAADRPFWPAALKQVVSVGALGPGDERAWFSNYGWWVDASAPGVDIASSFVRFDGPRRGLDDPDRFEGFASWSGTSFAAPAVAGRIAGLAASEGIGAVEAADRLLDPAAHRALPDLGVLVTS